MEIEKLQSLVIAEIKPGDVLILRSDKRLSMEQIERISASMQKLLPNNKCIVIDGGMALEVGRPTEVRCAG